MNEFEKEKGGCLSLILKALLFYGVYCLVYWLVEKFIPGGAGTVVEIVMFVIFTALFIAAANN